jgi:hypothetical protein
VQILTIDFETYYDRGYSLSKLTTEEYVRHPSFEVIGVSVAVDDEPPVWFSGTKKQIKAFLGRYDWQNSAALAHNAMFDMAILNWCFDIRPKRILDTLSMARALDGPDAGNSLAKLAERHGAGVKGDEVVYAMGKRRLDFSPEHMARYGEYCCNDTALTYKLFLKMVQGFPVSELRLIDLTIRMFTEPVLSLDVGVLTKHLANVKTEKERLLDKAIISKDNLMSNPQLAETLRSLGVEPPLKVSPTTGRDTYAFAKSDEAFKALLEHHDPVVQAIVSARLGVKSTLEETRTERFIQIAERGLLPIPLRFYAAHTGRWGGDDKVNMQNLPRKSPLKKAILAPEGYVVIDCDSSQIEARTLAWLSGQQDLVEAFDRGEDVYKIMAASIYGKAPDQVDKDERFVGKTTILGCFGPDTRVLTDAGWKHIVEVKATDMLWDGEEWVAHEGVVPQGVKETLTAHGVTATPDHEILTGHGWQEWNAVLTDPFLFQSAINRARLPSRDGSGMAKDTTLPSDASAGGLVSWIATTSRQSELRGVTHVLKKRLLDTLRSIGGTLISYQMTHIGYGCLTGSQAVLAAAITPKVRLTPITGVGASLFMSRGVQIEPVSCGTLFRSTAGMTQSVTSTGWTTPKGMNRATYVSLHEAKTCTTGAKSEPCKQSLMTYDIAYAGPRNRYTIATDAGPIIVHNCGYGMGATKFQAQLKTFNVQLDAQECKRIISVYRETYPMIPRLWREAGEALDAIASGVTAPLGREDVLRVAGSEGIYLPNGFRLQYPNLRWLRVTDKPEMVYDTKKGKTVIPKRIWGGAVVENVCQALARIIIGEQMLAITRRLRVAMTVHDSVIALAPAKQANEARAYVEQCMRMRPAWAQELPLNCESKMGASYGG